MSRNFLMVVVALAILMFSISGCAIRTITHVQPDGRTIITTEEYIDPAVIVIGGVDALIRGILWGPWWWHHHYPSYYQAPRRYYSPPPPYRR